MISSAMRLEAVAWRSRFVGEGPGAKVSDPALVGLEQRGPQVAEMRRSSGLSRESPVGRDVTMTLASGRREGSS